MVQEHDPPVGEGLCLRLRHQQPAAVGGDRLPEWLLLRLPDGPLRFYLLLSIEENKELIDKELIDSIGKLIFHFEKNKSN